jgi:regulatory protein
MRISSIQKQRRRGRWNIYADGEFIAGVSEETLLLFGLRKGDELTPDRLDAIRDAETRTMAKRSALRLLARRPRTVREIRDRLRTQEFSDKDITSIIEDLTRAGLLNDLTFAETYTRDALALRPAGKLLIKRNLLRLGVDASTVDGVIEQAFTTHAQDEAALALARTYLRKARALQSPADTRKVRNRLAAYLARRGYPWETIQQVVRKLLNGNQDVENPE